MQTGLIQNAHNDLVTDAAYDFYGLRLATCSLDQRIKVWQLDESDGNWTAVAEWKAHDAAVTKLSWAHPEFGSVLASASFDRTVKVWEETPLDAADQPQPNGTPAAANGPGTRWVERATIADAKGSVRAVEFVPHQFGLKLAAIASDNHLRVYECLEAPALTNWTLVEEADVLALPSSSASHPHTHAAPTPTQTASALAADASLVANALQQQQPLPPAQRGAGSREADGGWCVSWCKDRYWGEVLAAGCGVSGVVKIIQLSPSRRPITLLSLDPSPPADPTSAPEDATAPYAITSVAWAPSCGRSYHLVATGGRDGHVRIWKLGPSSLDEERVEGSDEAKWTGSVVADFDHHKSAVGRVEWNITGTVLSSAGNDGRVRLWKATSGSIWRPAGHITVEQAEEQQKEGDVEMDDGNPAE
ncbi:WD40-repeat-containing domain protein [Gloeopeniophorella convolvens]|nr:WD40-repeat-containing domain protein [Gloeopeniophorella convolvens]